jgi:hypothetical protein
MSAYYDKSVGFRFVFPETPKVKTTDENLHRVYENLIRLRNLEEKIEDINDKVEEKRKK